MAYMTYFTNIPLFLHSSPNMVSESYINRSTFFVVDWGSYTIGALVGYFSFALVESSTFNKTRCSLPSPVATTDSIFIKTLDDADGRGREEQYSTLPRTSEKGLGLLLVIPLPRSYPQAGSPASQPSISCIAIVNRLSSNRLALAYRPISLTGCFFSSPLRTEATGPASLCVGDPVPTMSPSYSRWFLSLQISPSSRDRIWRTTKVYRRSHVQRGTRGLRVRSSVAP